MGENFKLKWNDHHSIFFSTAEELCMEDNLTDITLSCGKQEFSAHKLVLSICSTYFKDLFAPRQNQKGNSKYLHRPASQAAIVYLKDVKPSHMELLLNFMYRGEIHVQEEELMDLLTTAKGLQIRGLSESELGEEESNHPSTIPKNKTAEASSPLKTKKNKAVKRPSKESQQPSTSKKIKEESVCESPDLSTENLATDDFAPDDHDLMEENQPEEDLTNFQEENVDEMSYDQTDLVQPEPKHNESSNEWLLSGEPVVEANNSDDDASITSSIGEENSKYFQKGESTGVSKNPKIKMNFPKKRGFPMPRRSIMSSEEKNKRLPYTNSEEMEIVQWIIHNQRFSEISGIIMWKDLEKDGILPNRSYQSMKERFKKHVLPKIREFDISQEDTNSFELHGLKKDKSLFTRKNPHIKNGTSSPSKKNGEEIDVKKKLALTGALGLAQMGQNGKILTERKRRSLRSEKMVHYKEVSGSQFTDADSV